jgi:hypothetical protein
MKIAIVSPEFRSGQFIKCALYPNPERRVL